MIAFLQLLDSIIWGAPLILLLTFIGIYFTIRLRLIQISHLKMAFYLIFRKEHNQSGDVSAFASLATVLAATIGTGNIVGVATAISFGGVGAIFWMWVIAWFGMATKYAEGFLAIKYRTYDSDGKVAGGPMYYIERGIGAHAKPLAKIFAVCGLLVALFGIGTFAQVNGITSALNDVFGVNLWVTGTMLSCIVALIILGGIKRIATVASIIVPFMALGYVICAFLVLVFNSDKIIPALMLIVHMAFSPQSFGGGVVGFTLMQAIAAGASRGIFSNEAGLGSAPIAAATSNTSSPVHQGLISMTGTFLDTIIICAMTALVIVITGAFEQGVEGAALTNRAFSQGLGTRWGSVVVTLGLVLFAFTTILGWNYYGERCLVYLTQGNTRFITAYRIVFIGIIFIAPWLSLQTVWIIADIVNGLMAVPNLIALFLLRHEIVRGTQAFFATNH